MAEEYFPKVLENIMNQYAKDRVLGSYYKYDQRELVIEDIETKQIVAKIPGIKLYISSQR